MASRDLVASVTYVDAGIQYRGGVRVEQLTLQQKIQAAAAAVIAISAFLPWASIFGISASGINGDGQITLILALVALFALATQTNLTGGLTLPPKLVIAANIACAAVGILVGIADMSEFAAIGLYLTLLASLVMAAAIIWEIRLRRGATTDTAEIPPASGVGSDVD